MEGGKHEVNGSFKHSQLVLPCVHKDSTVVQVFLVVASLNQNTLGHKDESSRISDFHKVSESEC